MNLPGHWNQKVVLDTNVILFDALAITTFKKVDIYIPLSVIEEIDQFKRDPGENGRNARYFSRFCDVLRNQGALSQGVLIQKSKSYVYVIADKGGLSSDQDFLSQTFKAREYKVDNRILQTALSLQKAFPGKDIELITKDINLRIKADVFGIVAKDYEPEKIPAGDLYKGFLDLSVSSEELQRFYKQKELKLENLSLAKKGLKGEGLYANQYVIFKDISNPKQSALARFIKSQRIFIPLSPLTKDILGIYPKNIEQSFSLDCLLCDDISFVSLIGKAGTGKTLLALAAGLYKTLEEGRFQRLLVSRPIFPMGRDIGYLPGDLEQKLNPWMQPIFDNIEFLMGSDKKSSERTKELIYKGIVNIEPLTYIRGRSISNQFFIVDESQNLTPHEIKTIITRAGQGTKVVLTGDSSQIDNPYVDISNSGLTHSIERFKKEELAAHVSLSKGERSKLAELAANVL